MHCLSLKLAVSLVSAVVVVAYLPSVATLSPINASLEVITPNQPLRNGKKLVSPNGDFELSFFSPGNSVSGFYLGIYFVDVVVWVANREKPFPATASAVLKVHAAPGGSPALVLVDSKTGVVFWSSSVLAANETTSRATVTGAKTVSARLEDSGNLVLVHGSNSTVWQSFDHPTNTLLAGMKIGWDTRTGARLFLQSWKSSEDPSPGSYTYSLDPAGVPQLFVRGPGGTPKTYMGYWNGQTFSALPEEMRADIVKLQFVADDKQVYYSYSLPNAAVQSRVVLDESGTVWRYMRQRGGKVWTPLFRRPMFKCDSYLACGPNTVCSNQQNNCSCIKGYDPADGKIGCTRKVALRCSKANMFDKMPGVKPPDMTNATMDMSMSPTQCQQACSSNCSCVAYAIANITSNNGCIMWESTLVDVEQFLQGGLELFVRQSAVVDNVTALRVGENAKKSKTKIIMVIAITTGFLFVAFMVGVLLLIQKKRDEENLKKERKSMEAELGKWGEEVTLFDFSVIASATNSFSFMNKIGQGGFGVVYKGTVNDGQQVAIKRLSMTSRQGLNEFMNEVKLIARLQHKNLVRLLGCCIDQSERILVYEYMKNKSLDKFIFGKREDKTLDWTKRISIINGIARGLLYLHEDSRLKIVHRDLKVANILLDGSMNPKISDFGTARIFDVDQFEDNTKRVIGTIGYMSPEYAIEGNFSAKSDVFSFGVIILEIISGQENTKSKHIPCAEKNLLALAWGLWQEGESMKLLDPTLVGKCSNLEVIRCVHIGLLCVQESPIDRPTMSSVVVMLSSDNDLPESGRPGIFHGKASMLRESHSSPSTGHESLALMTITEVGGR